MRHISTTYDEESSAVSPNSPSTVRVSPSSPFLTGDSLFASGDMGGVSGDSPELDSDPLWKEHMMYTQNEKFSMCVHTYNSCALLQHQINAFVLIIQ